MRRKSERASSKKTKTSPEKKLEKIKRTRGRRKKQSSSSENESAEDSPVRSEETVAEVEKHPPQPPQKDDTPEEGQDQVWRVKATEGAGDAGEIQKLKICLTRPPSTPERPERSPRSKRKHSRATSSSDTPSVEGPDEKKKSKHRSKRASKETKDESEKSQDSNEEADGEKEAKDSIQQHQQISDSEVTQSEPVQSTVVPGSTSAEGSNPSDSVNDTSTEPEPKQSDTVEKETEAASESKDKPTDADTTVMSSKDETTLASSKPDASPQQEILDSNAKTESSNSSEIQDKNITIIEENKRTRKRSSSVDKSEVLELHAEEMKMDITDIEINKAKEDEYKESAQDVEQNAKVSINNEKSINPEENSDYNKQDQSSTNKCGVVEKSNNCKDSKVRKISIEMDHDLKTDTNEKHTQRRQSDTQNNRKLECSNSTQSEHEESVQNGQVPPIVVNRKRRWGSRPNKITKQSSITISTDVLKDIIPDVKPTEFDEVIKEKSHKKLEHAEKFERPVLPKIVIDNTENVNQHRRDIEKEEKLKEVVKAKEPHLSVNRKISIVKGDNSIISRPPSPPRNQPSSFLYITNLVRPFTLLQLKNLLQRTGRIIENGFWIDKIKSRCYVKYETEDQAIETRHALHGVTWPVSNPKALQVDFSTEEAFEKARTNEDADAAQTSTIPGTVEDWLREQDQKRERGEIEKPWERKVGMREWDMGKGDKDKEKEKDKDKLRREERPMEKRRHRSIERSPEPARKFKKKEEEAPAKLLDDLFRKTKTTPCIYWLPLSAETIAIKEEQRRQHMLEHERRLQEQRRHRRH